MASNSPQTVNVNIPFVAKLEATHDYLNYIDHPLVENVSCHSSASKAKVTLKKKLIEFIEEAMLQKKNYRQRAIGTGDGSVFIVQFRHGSWAYVIAGPSRNYAGCVVCGPDSFDKVYEAAKNHAKDFGGVVWESSL